MAKKMKRGFGIQWHITNRCDQRCEHCYIYQSDKTGDGWGRELTLSECSRVLDNFLNFCLVMKCTPHITITGGDPLLCDHFWELMSLLYENGIPISLLGNPFHLDMNICSKLKEFGCRSYQMSLDGLEATHDLIRKPGSYSATLSKVPLLKGIGIRSTVMSTVSLVNYRDMPELTRIAVEHGVDALAFARYSPPDRDADNNIPPEEYRAFLETMWLIYTELADQGTEFILKDHLWQLFLFEKGLLKIEPQQMITDGCGCGVKHMAVLPDGSVYACRRFQSPIGNALTETFLDIFLGDKMNEYRNLDKMEGCSKCELLSYCRGCPAVAFGTFGNFYAKDPQCWKK